MTKPNSTEIDLEFLEFVHGDDAHFVSTTQDETWLRAEIQKSLDDPRPSLSFEEVEHRLDVLFRKHREMVG